MATPDGDARRCRRRRNTSAESGIAPLIGAQAASPTAAGAASDGSAGDNDYSATDLASASGTAMPLAAVSRTPASLAPSAVQRSAADRAHRAPGLGAPLPTAPTAATTQRAGSPDGAVQLPPVQRAVATPFRRARHPRGSNAHHRGESRCGTA